MSMPSRLSFVALADEGRGGEAVGTSIAEAESAGDDLRRLAIMAGASHSPSTVSLSPPRHLRPNPMGIDVGGVDEIAAAADISDRAGSFRPRPAWCPDTLAPSGALTTECR